MHVRQRSLDLLRGISAEDMQIQSMPDASPSKWHLAHTTWFFDHFILRHYQASYQPFDPHFDYLFNSYYDAVGSRHARPERGLLSRPALDQILAYRAHIDSAIATLLDQQPHNAELQTLVTTGLHHEMQHQELILTDLKHALSRNRYALPTLKAPHCTEVNSPSFSAFGETITRIGDSGKGFSYDCEKPVHRVFLEPYRLRNCLVTNAEWLEFMQAGGYRDPTHWLSDGWYTCQQQQWQHPLYWEQKDGVWIELTLDGYRPLALNAPVCHISYYEADAFCRWAGWRLPTEFEWEHAAREGANLGGHFADSNHWHPQANSASESALAQMYGSVWEWTSSAFAPYPGFEPLQGALGEYNGKFMANQYVLKGGSCATAAAQMRHSYRNFFHPHQRWQFSGVRPAKN
nr:ergothioneine biosynthesis protein EgtB [Gilvimarinus xylanilyticus]